MNFLYQCGQCSAEFNLSEELKVCPHCRQPISRANDKRGEIGRVCDELKALVDTYKKTDDSKELRAKVLSWKEYVTLPDFHHVWRDFVLSAAGEALTHKNKELQSLLKNHARELDKKREGSALYLALLQAYPKLGTNNDWDELIQNTQGDETKFAVLCESIIHYIVKTQDKAFAIDIFKLIRAKKAEWKDAGRIYIRALLSNEDVAAKVFCEAAFDSKTSKFAEELKVYCNRYLEKGHGITVEQTKVWANHVAACKVRRRRTLIAGGIICAVIISVAIALMFYLNAIRMDSITFQVDKVIETTYGEELSLDGFFVTYQKNSGETVTEPLSLGMLHGYDKEAVGVQQTAYFEFQGVTVTVTIIISAEQLQAPKLTQEGNYITWDTVPHADHYVIYVNATSVETEQTTALSYDLSRNVNFGELSITVRAIPASDKYLASPQSETLTVQKLEAPKNLVYVGGKLSWNSVEGAVTYELTINGTPYVTDIPECNVSFVKGENTVVINAKGTSESVVYGVTQETIFYDRLSPISGMSYQDGSVFWQASEDAKSFSVYVDGTYWRDFSRNNFSVIEDSFAETFGEGAHEIGVVCQSAAVGIEPSEMVTYRVALGNRIYMEDETLRWTSLGTGATYFVSVNGSSYTFAQAYFPLSQCEWQVGNNLLTVTARLNGEEYICETVTVVKHAAPTVTLSDQGWVNQAGEYDRYRVNNGAWETTLPDITSLTVGDHTVYVKRVVFSATALEIESDVVEIKIKRPAAPSIKVEGGVLKCAFDETAYELTLSYRPTSSDRWVTVTSLSDIATAGEYYLRATLKPKADAFPDYDGFLSSDFSAEITVVKPQAPDISYDASRGLLSSTTPGAKFYYTDEHGQEHEIMNGKTANLPGGMFKVYARVPATGSNVLDSEVTPEYARISVFNLDIDFSVTRTDERMCNFVFGGCTDIESLTYTYTIEYLTASDEVIGGIDKSSTPITSSAKRGDAIIQSVNYRLEGVFTDNYSHTDVKKIRVTVTIDGGSDVLVKTYTVVI